MTDKVVSFPGVVPKEVENKADLGEWLSSIAGYVKDVPLDHAILILVTETGEQSVYCMNDIRKDQYVGLLHIATLRGILDGVD